MRECVSRHGMALCYMTFTLRTLQYIRHLHLRPDRRHRMQFSFSLFFSSLFFFFFQRDHVSHTLSHSLSLSLSLSLSQGRKEKMELNGQINGWMDGRDK